MYKRFVIGQLLIVLSACSFEAFRENIILPNLDYEEGEAKIENYLL
ncbi:hypothetical protein [Pseudogracilibacillus sp. SO30301A]